MITTRPKNDNERCIIVKISFTDYANSYKFQNLESADLDFLVEGEMMQDFFNSLALDIYKKKGWEIPEVLKCYEDEGEEE